MPSINPVLLCFAGWYVKLEVYYVHCVWLFSVIITGSRGRCLLEISGVFIFSIKEFK